MSSPENSAAPVATSSPALAHAPEYQPGAPWATALRYVLLDGVLWSLMVGIGESYLALFALAVTNSEIASGLMATVPMLCGAVLQLASPWGVRKLGSQKRWVVLCVSIQALSFLPLAAIALIFHVRPIGNVQRLWLVPVLFGVAAFYWAGGHGAGGAWTTWMSNVVPPALRTRYFSVRTRWTQFGALTSFVVTGFYLDAVAQDEYRIPAFATLFAAALAFRSLSAFLLSQTPEYVPLAPNLRRVKLGEWLGRLLRGGDLRLLQCILVVQFTSNISSPFFTPFIIRELKLEYREWMILFGTTLLFKILSTPVWGLLASRFSARAVLVAAGLGIVPSSVLWVFNQDFYYLIGAQVWAGVAWGAWDLALVLLTFELIRESERTSILTIQNLFFALAIVSGSTIGGTLLRLLGSTFHAYMILFAVSSAARLLALPFIWRLYRGK